MWRFLFTPERSEYTEQVLVERLPSAVRTAATIILVLNAAFVGLDAYAFPEFFWKLFAARMALNASLLAAYVWTVHRWPRVAQLQLVLSAGMLLLWAIYCTGAPTTEYYAGLMLLFLGCPLVLPLTVGETLLSYSFILGVFLASPLFEPHFAAWETFTIHALFLGGGAFTGVASSRYLESVRLKEFKQRKEIESARDRLQELDHAKSRFTANVHHELRTPLTLMLAPIESFLAGEFGDLSDTQRSYLRTMHVNALRLLKLVSDLLDLAKVESNQLGIHRRPIDLRVLAERLVAGAQPLAERKGVTLRLRTAATLPFVNADVDAVDRVMMNLLGNALKFTSAGDSIDVELEANVAGDGIVCRIRDSGIGIESNQLERIFDRFAQVDSSATRRHEGTGIGLSLSRELVALHGGTLSASSGGLGAGATFIISLPKGEPDGVVDEPILLAEATNAEQYSERDGVRYCELARTVEREQPVGKRDRVDEELGAEGKPRIVVCEDNPDMRRLLRDLLRREFSVRVAENGRAGLELVRQHGADLVLTDVMMPEMSGIDLCQQIKESPITTGIPVVLITSKAEREMKIAGLEGGADDYVTKPFHSRELLARVRSLIRLRILQAELAERNHHLQQVNEDLASMMQELKEAESQIVRAERLAAVGELAAGVAHEINNPVNFAKVAAEAMGEYLGEIKGAVNLLRGATGASIASKENGDRGSDKGLSDDRLVTAVASLEDLAGIVRDGLDRTGRLVGDLRDLAMPWSGPHSRIDIVRVAQSALQLARYRLQNAGVSVAVCQEGPIPEVVGEARALGQVFLNLLKNCAEALEGRGGTLEVTIRADGGFVIVEFRDDGPGIDRAVLDRLFEPFFTTKPAGKGTGLGLSISRHVVEKHGGRMSVTSTVGSGSTFSVWLPCEAADGE